MTLTSGGAAFKPGKGAAIGGALNGGVVSLTKGLANELADKRIRVNTVVPGLVKTELWDKLGHSKEKQEEIFNKGSKDLSVGFVATPTDIAEAYLYTVRADYANGTLVVIGKPSEIFGDPAMVNTSNFCCRWWFADLDLYGNNESKYVTITLSVVVNIINSIMRSTLL